MNQIAHISYEDRAKARAKEIRLRLMGPQKRVNVFRRGGMAPVEPIALPKPKPLPRLVQSIPVDKVIPLHFNTFKQIRMTWGGEYSAYAGGSTLIAMERSMIEIALHWLKRFPGVTVSDIKGGSRKRRVVLPRQVVWHAIKTERDLSFPQVGLWMGGRDHTTGLHSCNKVQAMIDAGTLEAEIEKWNQLHGKGKVG